jgi:peptidoglycan/xylan/chitin deacetylase (PgdA/CDA1 family)
MPVTLLYHDVVAAADAETSGFPGSSAAHYKLDPELFRRHLDALAAVVPGPPLLIRGNNDPATGWCIAFDDGGRTALAPTADLLEARGWRGLFFITTDVIGTPPFLSASQIRELHRRGHVIGSHSTSHPPRMSACSDDRIRREWQTSRAVLADILGEAPTTASVPGGFYSRAVARLAAEAGYSVLFNSEPTTGHFHVDNCLIVGRYSVVRTTTPQQAAALVAGGPWPRWRQAIVWNVKKVAKSLAGGWYARFRERRLSSGGDGQ